MALRDIFGSDDESDTEPPADADSDSVSDSTEDESEPTVNEEDTEYTKSDVEEAPSDENPGYELPDEGFIDKVANLHQDFIAPTEMNIEDTHMLSGQQLIRNYYINEWPNKARPGFLEPIFADASYDTDISIHLDPRNRASAKRALKSNMGDIRAEYERTKDPARKRDLKKNLSDAERMYDLVSQQGKTLFDIGTYVNFRVDRDVGADSINELESDYLEKLQVPPTDTDPRVSRRVQDRGMVSTSPLAEDVLGKKKPMLSAAAASMMPFSSATLIENSGIDYGIQQHNGSPVVVDRFSRDTGYNMATIGDIGSGKSFSTKLQIARTLMRDQDVEVMMLDPLNGFEGLNAALDGDKILVGGSEGLNPLELKETPQHVLDAAGEGAAEKLDPLGNKIKDVMSFFDTYFSIEGIDIGAERGILQDAIQRAYTRKGITHDHTTHSKESPTVRDVLSILEEMSENPSKFSASNSSYEKERVGEYAGQLLVALKGFRQGGQYSNLAKHTEIEPGANRVTYLDLSQQEGGKDGLGLMMQLLFNMAYERAKNTENKVILVIDEARYLMKNSANLKFLEQAVRHSRHYDLSIHFITQTVEEFYQHAEAEAILDNCSMMQLCQLSSLNSDLASDALGLNGNQINYVKNAQAGDEGLDYSEALLNVGDNGWYPLQIRAHPDEAAVVDYDTREDNIEELPGHGMEADNNKDAMEQLMDRQVEQKTSEEHQQAREEAQRGQRVKGFLLDEDFRSLTLSELGANRSQVYKGDFEDTSGDDLSNTEPDTEANLFEYTPDDGVGTNLYHVRFDIYQEDAPDSDSLPALEDLSNGFEVFSTDPSELALRAGNYDGTFDALIGTAVAPETFCHALYGIAEVDNVAVTDISSTVDWADEDVEMTPNSQLENAAAKDNEEVTEEFERMKEEEELKGMDVDEGGFQNFE
jgi:hypothetical protein